RLDGRAPVGGRPGRLGRVLAEPPPGGRDGGRDQGGGQPLPGAAQAVGGGGVGSGGSGWWGRGRRGRRPGWLEGRGAGGAGGGPGGGRRRNRSQPKAAAITAATAAHQRLAPKPFIPFSYSDTRLVGDSTRGGPLIAECSVPTRGSSNRLVLGARPPSRAP